MFTRLLPDLSRLAPRVGGSGPGALPRALALAATLAPVLAPALAPTGARAEGLSFSGYSAPGVFAGLASERARRFDYRDLGESRPQKARRTLKLTLGGAGGEVRDIFTFPFREPGTTAAFVLGTAALIAVDRQTTAFWQDHVETFFSGLSLPASSGPISTESKIVLGAIGLTWAAGYVANDERAQTAALLSTKAIAYSYLTSQVVLKPIFGRLRPVPSLSTTPPGRYGDFTTDPWQFGYRRGIPWKGGAYGTAMPSFHFTQYFAVARVYSGVYDTYLVPYALAGLISAVNIRGHRHWVSDMVAGAVIGTGIGNLVLNRYEARKGAADAMVIPIVSSQGVGLQLSMSF